MIFGMSPETNLDMSRHRKYVSKNVFSKYVATHQNQHVSVVIFEDAEDIICLIST